MTQRLPLLIAVLVAGLGLTITWQSTNGFRAFTWESYRRLQVEAQPLAVPNILLQDHNGERLDLESLRGKVLVVNFIYTRCSTVCGTTGLVYSHLQAVTVQHGYADKVRLLSISLDPQYDTPGMLHGYLQRFSRLFDGNWKVLRPLQPQQAQHLLRQLGVVSIPDGTGGITHNAATHIIDQQGRLVRIIDEDQPEQVLLAIRQLLPSPGPGLHADI